MDTLRRLHRRHGQTGTEVLVVISVVVIAIASAGYLFVPTFRTGVNRLGTDVRRMLSTGQRTRSRMPTRGNPGLGDYTPGGRGPFRLPGAVPNAGCASGVVCLPEERSPLGAPVDVCRRGDNC